MVRWGVLGTANIARICVMPAIQASKNGVMYALSSRDISRARKQAVGYENSRAYGSYEALLDDPGVDAVYIPLPNNLHKEWTLKALAAGKHVLVEKPFAMNAAEAEVMVAEARKQDRLLMEAFMYRFQPRSQRIKGIVDAGELGPIRLIHSAFSFHVVRDGSNERLYLPEMGGGSLWDVGCYGVSLARWLLGREPVRVSAQAIYGESGVDTSFIGTLQFAIGALAVVESSFTAALQQTYSVLGEKGVIELPHNAYIPWGESADFLRRDPNAEEGEIIRMPNPDQYRLMIEHFEEAVLGGGELIYAPEESIKQMQVLDALAQSARSGKVIELDQVG